LGSFKLVTEGLKKTGPPEKTEKWRIEASAEAAGTQAKKQQHGKKKNHWSPEAWARKKKRSGETKKKREGNWECRGRDR